jgi:hypothetical protein
MPFGFAAKLRIQDLYDTFEIGSAVFQRRCECLDIVAPHAGVDPDSLCISIQLQSLLIAQCGARYVHTRITAQTSPAREPLTSFNFFLTQYAAFHLCGCGNIFTQHGDTAAAAYAIAATVGSEDQAGLPACFQHRGAGIHIYPCAYRLKSDFD